MTYNSEYRRRTGKTSSWYENNRGHVLTQQKIRRETKTSRYILAQVKHRCKRDGIPFDLTADDIVVPTHCPILGVELIVGGPRDQCPSLDRTIPSKGYVRGNVAVISYRANRFKSDCTDADELQKIVDYIRNIS